MTVEEADAVWKLVCNLRKAPNWAERKAEDVISEVQSRGHTEFASRFAIPLRYMVVYNEYSHDVFKKYLARLEKLGYKSQEEWVERQADYAKMLWRKYNPHGDTAEGTSIWAATKKGLLDEMNGFKQDFETAKIVAEEKNKDAFEEKRKRLLEIYLKNLNSQN